MFRPLAAAALFAAALAAQTPAPAGKPLAVQDPMALEKILAAHAIAAFKAQIAACEALKLYGRALPLRLELLHEYDENDAEQRDKCGYTKVGDVWRLDGGKVVLDRDAKVDAGKLKKLDQEFDKARPELAQDHERAGDAWQHQNDRERALYHWRRALRFKPADPALSTKLQLTEFDGFAGTERELMILRRSRMIRCAVDFLKRMDFPTEKVTDKSALLTKAGIAHTGVRSEHFVVQGSLTDKQLVAAACWAERCLLLSRSLFARTDGVWEPKSVKNILLVPDRPSYLKALQASGEFAPARYEFQKDLSLAFVHEGQDDLRLYCINERDDEMLDQVVRGVVQDGAGIFTDGLWEGTGHALNGFFFDQTLTFLVAPKKANTVTNWQPKALMPDMETWRQIAGESAWAKIDTPIARLVMIKASNFTNEERVKAWAMVDYLLRWRPELVRELDTCRGPTNGDAVAVEAEFRRRTQLLLPTIDAEWRDYWARMQKVRELTKQGPTGTPEQQKDMRALADAINGARAAASVGPIGYYLGKSADVQALLKYGDELAKAEAEQKKNPKIAVPLPTMPAVIDKSVLLGTADAAGSVASWLLRPGARDLLLSPGRMLIATGKYKGNYLLDLGEVPTPRISGVPYVYPRNGQRDVPAAVTVAELGPELAALLAKKGKQPTDKVGYPVSLHFFRMLPDNVLDALEIDGNLGSGVTWLAQGEGSALDRAAGCIVFVPLEPLLTGRPLSVSWTLPPNLLKKEEKLREVKFTAK